MKRPPRNNKMKKLSCPAKSSLKHLKRTLMPRQRPSNFQTFRILAKSNMTLKLCKFKNKLNMMTMDYKYPKMTESYSRSVADL